MRADVQSIFKMTPHEKQVMMFSATLSKEIRPVCKKFMNEVNKLMSITTTTPSHLDYTVLYAEWNANQPLSSGLCQVTSSSVSIFVLCLPWSQFEDWLGGYGAVLVEV